MKHPILFLVLAFSLLLPSFADAKLSTGKGRPQQQQSGKCETYEDDEDCPRRPNDGRDWDGSGEPTRPADPNGPDYVGGDDEI